MDEVILCPYFLEAMEQETDCKHRDCKRHLLYYGLKLKEDRLHKTALYYQCHGCDSYNPVEWTRNEIAELWGHDKQLIEYYEKNALKKMRRRLIRNDKERTIRISRG
jgi:hypothetical protein